jgi:hypothetical protein
MYISLQTQVKIEDLASQLSPTDIIEILSHKLTKHPGLSHFTSAQKRK